MNSIGRTPTGQQQAAAGLCASFLDEAKLRIAAIDDAVSGRIALHPSLLKDFCYLQLRFLCELIALGCLTAHGDIDATQAAKLQTESAPGKIIKQLERLHPNFYPHPVKLTITPGDAGSPGHVHMDRIEAGFITRKEVAKLWALCGGNLHKGNLRGVVEQIKNPKPYDPSEIVLWVNKIILLLDRHHIASADNLSHFICVLQSADHDNRALVSIALSPLPK